MESRYIMTAVYHPKPGKEKEFLRIWEENVAPLAKRCNVVSVSMYQNEETGEFLSIGHWADMEGPERFFESAELEEVASKINAVSLIPATREMYTILKEERVQRRAA